MPVIEKGKKAARFAPSVSRGKRASQPRVVVYGEGGVGKSTFASGAPNPLLIDIDRGSDSLDIARVDNVFSWDELVECVRFYANDIQGHGSLIIDTADAAERMAYEKLCALDGSPSIEAACGGYGKGYAAALELFRGLLSDLDAVRNRHDVPVIVLAHAKTEEVVSEDLDRYNRWTLKMHARVGGLFVEAFDIVAFAHENRTVKKDKKGRGRAQHSGSRLLEVYSGPTWVAKNRYGMTAPIEMLDSPSDSWSSLMAAIRGETSSSPEPQPADEDRILGLEIAIDKAIEELRNLDGAASFKAEEERKDLERSEEAMVAFLERVEMGIEKRKQAS